MVNDLVCSWVAFYRSNLVVLLLIAASTNTMAIIEADEKDLTDNKFARTAGS
jgi:hypothetical protein